MYDAGVGRHYYWNPENDEVCWLSPTHPKAVISDPAPKLAKGNFLLSPPPEREAESLWLPVVFDKVAKRLAADAERKKAEAEGGRRRGRRERSPKRKAAREEEPDPLDPMDPAAYSDVPRGKWSSGLDTQGEDAVTGADVTASGALFQSRPYPSPGAILRKSGKKPPEGSAPN